MIQFDSTNQSSLSLGVLKKPTGDGCKLMDTTHVSLSLSHTRQKVKNMLFNLIVKNLLQGKYQDIMHQP
jgi:hypothetical protein